LCIWLLSQIVENFRCRRGEPGVADLFRVFH
jgi:hypothetical protein